VHPLAFPSRPIGRQGHGDALLLVHGSQAGAPQAPEPGRLQPRLRGRELPAQVLPAHGAAGDGPGVAREPGVGRLRAARQGGASHPLEGHQVMHLQAAQGGAPRPVSAPPPPPPGVPGCAERQVSSAASHSQSRAHSRRCCQLLPGGRWAAHPALQPAPCGTSSTPAHPAPAAAAAAAQPPQFAAGQLLATSDVMMTSSYPAT